MNLNVGLDVEVLSLVILFCDNIVNFVVYLKDLMMYDGVDFIVELYLSIKSVDIFLKMCLLIDEDLFVIFGYILV